MFLTRNNNSLLMFFAFKYPLAAPIGLYIYYYFINKGTERLDYQNHKYYWIAIVMVLIGFPYIAGMVIYLFSIFIQLLGMLTIILAGWALRELSEIPYPYLVIDLIISLWVILCASAVVNKKKIVYFWLGIAVPLLAYIFKIPAFN